MNVDPDTLFAKAAVGAAGVIFAWSGWVTRRVLKHETLMVRLETKMDMLLEHFGVKKEKP